MYTGIPRFGTATAYSALSVYPGITHEHVRDDGVLHTYTSYESRACYDAHTLFIGPGYVVAKDVTATAEYSQQHSHLSSYKRWTWFSDACYMMKIVQ